MSATPGEAADAQAVTSLVAAAGFGDPAPVFQALDVEGFLLQRRA
jgi:hypothetical protein